MGGYSWHKGGWRKGVNGWVFWSGGFLAKKVLPHRKSEDKMQKLQKCRQWVNTVQVSDAAHNNDCYIIVYSNCIRSLLSDNANSRRFLRAYRVMESSNCHNTNECQWQTGSDQLSRYEMFISLLTCYDLKLSSILNLDRNVLYVQPIHREDVRHVSSRLLSCRISSNFQ